MSKKTTLNQALVAVSKAAEQDVPPPWFYKRLGICGNVESYILYRHPKIGGLLHRVLSVQLHTLICRWPDLGSNSPWFPVGGPAEFHSYGSLWDNQRRWQLLEWLINAH